MTLHASLTEAAEKQITEFHSTVEPDQSAWLDQQLKDNSFNRQLHLVWSCSEFVATTCRRNPQMFRDLVESGDLKNSYTEDTYRQRLKTALQDCPDETDFHKKLRLFRRREMLRLIWRDFTRLAEMEETTRDVTHMAEASIDLSLQYLYPHACTAWGTPIGSDSGKPQQLVVLGMGKIGAWELNLSSDIDLIFAYPEAGETRGGKRQLSNQEFFVRLGQKLIQALDNPTADGFVFRVDMRLRPYGESGALVLNFDAMEEYYYNQGRDWERYAMIKARVVAGDREAGRELMEVLRPFSFRKYIDYSVIQSLRDMKTLISREVQRRGLANDIKRGAGGIREVEFIVQAFQLIRGGRDRRFRDPVLANILKLLASEQMLNSEEAGDLWQAYRFLRNTEHALQGWRDQQTQALPDDEAGRLRIAAVMGFDDWESFDGALKRHRTRVREVFDDMAEEPHTGAEGQGSAEDHRAETVWRIRLDRETGARELEGIGFGDGAAALELLENLRDSRQVGAMQAEARKRLDRLVPRLLHDCGQVDNSVTCLQRIVKLLEAVVRRSAYLVLLNENPDARKLLVRLFSISPWIAAELAQYPALLDELLDPRSLFSPPDRALLQDELRQQLLRIPNDDLEAQMEALRYFRRAHSLRVSACEVVGSLPLMKVSDYLTWLAEVILEHVQVQAWEQICHRHGMPGRQNGEAPGFLVVGYGKLGGIEMGHSSDLDLVFVHNADPYLETDGGRSIDNGTYFVRLGQRIIHILSTQMASGTLYEVDMRLRPSGNSGMLVTSLASFEKYQREQAWTWEHQALVRARPVAGDPRLAAAFEDVRHRILQQPRDEDELRREVLDMRRKMREHLGSGAADLAAGKFNLKQDPGGIVDIEFMVQFAVLAWSREHPELTRWSDNIRILDSLEESGLMSAADAETLREAYKDYRAAGHRLQLEQTSGVVEAAEFADRIAAVRALWLKLLGEDSESI